MVYLVTLKNIKYVLLFKYVILSINRERLYVETQDYLDQLESQDSLEVLELQAPQDLQGHQDHQVPVDPQDQQGFLLLVMMTYLMGLVRYGQVVRREKEVIQDPEVPRGYLESLDLLDQEVCQESPVSEDHREI